MKDGQVAKTTDVIEGDQHCNVTDMNIHDRWLHFRYHHQQFPIGDMTSIERINCMEDS